MSTETPSEKQTRRNSELPNLTIAEKVCDTQFTTNLAGYRIYEPDLMLSMIRDIIGDNQPPPDIEGHYRPSDDLAHLLINLRKEGDFNEIGKRGLDEAIEICFLHSATYQAALGIYCLEHEGRLVGSAGGSAFESLQAIVDGSDNSEEKKSAKRQKRQ